MFDDPPLMNYDDAAAWLGVRRKWLEQQVQLGKAPCARLGKHVRFSREHLDAIVRAGEATQKAKTARGSTAQERRQGSIGRRRS